MKKKKSNKTYLITGIILIAVLIAGYLYMANEKSSTVTIKTSKGDIVVELNPSASPVTVENFLKYVDSGYYDGTIFHRVIDGFMIQGGGFTPDGKEKNTNSPIKLESNNGLKNLKGTIAMARTNAPDSATSQFFINTVDNDFLDYASTFNPGYAVFGEVTEGIEIVESIEKVQTSTKNRMQDWPVEDVVILSISRN